MVQAFGKTTTDSAFTVVSTEGGDCDDMDKFASRSISPDDAIRLLTAAYHLSTEEATALLPSGGTKGGSHNHDVITPGSFKEPQLSLPFPAWFLRLQSFAQTWRGWILNG